MRFGRHVEFFVIYIKEAHPEDGWVLSANRRSRIEVPEPASVDERSEVAAACTVRLRLRMPVLLDGMDNRVAFEYGGWPDRLYLVGCDGRIAFQGDAGPFGFKPELLEEAIERELERSGQIPASEARSEGLCDPAS